MTTVSRTESLGLEVEITGPCLTQRDPPRHSENARWVNQGETVKIQNVDISSGLFYHGQALALPDGRIIDQYAINPRLGISPTQADVGGTSMTYWPSYTSISPAARRAFLEWMAGGRKDPACGIGFILLFLYGLEHKLFIEGDPFAACVSVPEVDRLISIYGQNNSFRGYAANFLIYARLAAGLPLEPPPLSPERSASPDPPPAVRIHLGKRLATSNVLDADDVLLWLLGLPEFYLRTPAIRYFNEFVALWKLRFAEKYPSGFQVDVPTKKIKCIYRAASGAFQVELSGSHSQYPDIAAAHQSLDKLKSLAQACTDELDGYGRYKSKGRRYSGLHRATAAPDEPITISPKNRIADIPISQQPEPGINIDAERLAMVRKQTQAVAEILTQIFSDDAGDPKPVTDIPQYTKVSPFKGLDRSFAELVEYMEMKGEVARQEFDERAKSLKLLPAGAIETINDWSFDHFDEPLLEEGEHIVLSANLRDRLSELRAIAS